MNREKTVKLFAAIAVIMFTISLLPLLKVSFYDRATGDDYGYGAVTRQALLKTHSASAVIGAACGQVKDFWYSYQGTWFSVFIFAFQPEVFSLKAYWIVAWIALALTISSVSVFLYTVLVRVMGWPVGNFVIVDCASLFVMIQFVFSPRSAIFWYNGVAHYIVPFALALFSMNCFIRFIQTERNRYVVTSAVMMALLGGMSYLSAFMAPLFLLLVWIMSYRRGRYVWKLGIPMALECTGLIISAAAPGNANRGGSSYSVSFGRAAEAAGQAVLQGTKALPAYFKAEPAVFLIMVIILYFIWDAVSRAETGFKFSKPWLVLIWLYLIYCAMYWPGIFANVSVSGGVPNTIFQVMVIMLVLGSAYLAGWISRRDRDNSRNKICRAAWILTLIFMSAVTFKNKGTLKKSTDYVTMKYISSGQAEDYRTQMDEFTRIMTDPDITDARVHASNCDQGPLMHMPVTDDPGSFTNDAAARFFGKRSVISNQ